MSKFCPNCGRSLPDDAVFCDGCGASLTGRQSPQQNNYQQQSTYQQPSGYPQQNSYQQPNSYPQQNNYGQSNNYPQQGNKEQAEEKKSRLPLLVGICAVALLAAGGLLMLRNIGKTDGGGGEMSDGPVAYKVVEKPAEEEEKEQTAEVSGKETENTEEAERIELTGEENTTGEKPEESQEETTGAVQVGSMDATKEPVFDDFRWLIDYVPPTDAERIRDAARIAGTWKCYSYYFDVYEAVALDELSLVTISGNNDSITVSEQQLGLYNNGNLELDEHGYAPLQYTGTFEDGKIYTAGDGNFAIDDFSEIDGKQYAVGSQIMPSGEEFTIYMVRP